MEGIIIKRLQVINTKANTEVIANAIIAELVENGKLNNNHADAVSFVFRYLSNMNITTLVQLDVDTAYIKVKYAIAEDFLGNYENVEGIHKNNPIVMAFFNDITLDKLYDDTYTYTKATADKFEAYINKEIPNVLPKYEFDVAVTYSVEETLDVDRVTGRIERRIGANAYRKWSAAVLTNVVAFATLAEDRVVGNFTFHIKGNATYTPATIEKAIKNRIGADAKKYPWTKFVFGNIDVKNA